MGTGTALLVGAAAAVGALAGAGWGLRRRRRLDRELHDARRRTEAARTARHRFFELATHELRGPLTAILGFQELLRDGAYGELTGEARDAVVRIGRAGRQLLALVDGVIELAGIQAGDVRPDIDDVDLGILLATTAETLRSRAGERGVEARARIPDRVPAIRSDGARIRRVLDLMVTSAVRHPAGTGLEMDVDIGRDAVTVALGPVALDIDADDPGAGGLRMAVAAGTARLLGGELSLGRTAAGQTLTLRVAREL